MAVSALPFSALSVTASVYKDQTANGGTPYDFVLKEQGTGVQEIQVSKDDVDAGNVTKTLDVFIDSDEWADDNYLNQVTLNWITTRAALSLTAVQLTTRSIMRMFSMHRIRVQSTKLLCRTVLP